MWPFGKRIESVFRVSYFFEAKALIINYENLVRGQITDCYQLRPIWINYFYCTVIEKYRTYKDDRRQNLVILSISTEKPMLKEVPVVNGEK